MVSHVSEGFGTITPHLVLKNTSEAMSFYEKAFGAEEMCRMNAPGGNGVMYGEMRIGNSMLMLADEFPDMPGPRAPESLGGVTATMHIYSEDVDAAFQRAVDAGAEGVMPPMDSFWGDRYARLVDPFGVHWSIATHIEDVAPEEMESRMMEWMKNNPC